ncbi:hypothetical protein M3Y98_00891600 [Aphelenchoides besseyi]|nr:hypothetical protein M3Y98_00891600 [Aphelenchoides besseyi]
MTQLSFVLVSFLLVAFALVDYTVAGQKSVDGSTEVRLPLPTVGPPQLRALNTAIAQVLAQRGDRNHRHRRGGRRNPAKKYYKPFYRALKRDDRREVKQILRANITKAEIANKIEKWVHEQEDSKTTEAFNLFIQERELMRKLRLIGEENFLNGKSREARDLFAKLKGVREDQSLTWDQTCTRRNELLHSADQDAVRELRRKGRPCSRNNSWERLTGLGGKKRTDEE